MNVKALALPMTLTVGDAKSEAGDRVGCDCYFVFFILSLLFSLFCALSNKLLTSHNGLKSRSAEERYTMNASQILM
ncbi:hypothetical protein T01_7400 [Trichinella spiralis]|uniref:Uncharacterized protein n=1 Tax=Trichinella spiralis TaxID=6334 RepID=A0A0V1BLX7_TRISP|nr:hypothetical protein T01_7400 [Trichinella spiralis]